MNDALPFEPGAGHARLEPLAGTWGFEGTLSIEGQRDVHLRGSSRHRMIFEGRFLSCVVTGEISPDDGAAVGAPDAPQRFQGRGLLGYDPLQARYVSNWISSTDTELAHLEGTWDAEHRAFTFRGFMNDPISGARVATSEVITIHDDGTHHFLKSIGGLDGADVPILALAYRPREG